jgi:uncharacterized membrane protein YkvA (DUF1232 family)
MVDISLITNDFIIAGAKRVKKNDIKYLTEEAFVSLDKRFRYTMPLSKYIKDYKEFKKILLDYQNGKKTNYKWSEIAIITFTLLYVDEQEDIIPDYIRDIGLLDDGIVLAKCLAMIESKHKQIKNN